MSQELNKAYDTLLSLVNDRFYEELAPLIPLAKAALAQPHAITQAAPAALALLPEREGQPEMLTMAVPHEAEQGHWYSPAAVRRLLAEQAAPAAPASDATAFMRELANKLRISYHDGDGTFTGSVTAHGWAKKLESLASAIDAEAAPAAPAGAEGCARFESEAQIVEGRMVIALRVSTLAHAARHSEYFDLCAENGMRLHIVDEAVFAESVCRALNAEQENGSTPITRMLDEAFEHVCEWGEDGVEEEGSTKP